MIKFGPAGNCEMFYAEGNKVSLDAPKWLRSKGLRAYEYSFGRGFTFGFDKAKMLGEEVKKNEIEISVHAPYYINFANTDDVMILKSFGYIEKSIQFLRFFGGSHVVFHTAAQGKLPRQDAVELAKTNLKRCIEYLRQKGETFKGINLCAETMGKYSQIGDVDEIIDICSVDEVVIPAFDFGHINCLMQGNLKTEEDYLKIFNKAIEKLGYDRVKNCHIHFSQIEFSEKGEIRHLNFGDNEFGPDFRPLGKALVKLNLEPMIISESRSHMTADALTMKEIYEDEKSTGQ